MFVLRSGQIPVTSILNRMKVTTFIPKNISYVFILFQC